MTDIINVIQAYIVSDENNVKYYYMYLLRDIILDTDKVFIKKKSKKLKAKKNGLIKSALSYLCYYADIKY